MTFSLSLPISVSVCQKPTQTSPVLYSARCGSVSAADDVGWEGQEPDRTTQGAGEGAGRRTSAAAAGQPSRVTGRTQHTRVWKQTTGGSSATSSGSWRGEQQGGSSSIWELGVANSRWITAIPEGSSGIQTGRQPGGQLPADRSQNPVKGYGREPERTTRGLEPGRTKEVAGTRPQAQDTGSGDLARK